MICLLYIIQMKIFSVTYLFKPTLFSMDVFRALTSNAIDTGLGNNEVTYLLVLNIITSYLQAGLPSGSSLFLGVFITLVPKVG